MKKPGYNDSVFINCPFDPSYTGNLRAMVFTIMDCGFAPRSALEEENSADVRIDKIFRLISQSRYGIHDISMCKVDSATGLSRFNMPFELGIFLGARKFGQNDHKKKCCLVLDTHGFRYRKSLSDLSGQDIKSRGSTQNDLIKAVRDWLANSSERQLPGVDVIRRHYKNFNGVKSSLCKELDWRWTEITHLEYRSLVATWLDKNT